MKLILLILPLVFLLASCADEHNADLDRDHTLNIESEGGTRYLVEIDVKSLISNLAGNPRNPDFALALDECFNNINGQLEGIENLRTYSKNHPDLRLNRFFNLHNPDRFPSNYTINETIDQLKEEYQIATDHTINIIEGRLLRMPELKFNVYSKGTDLIAVEIENTMQVEQAYRLIQTTANLGFYDTYPSERIGNNLLEFNNAYTSSTTNLDSLKYINFEKNPEFQNGMFAYLSFNYGVGMPSTVGHAKGRDTAKINEILNLNLAKSYIPYDVKLLWQAQPDKYLEEPDCFYLYCIQLAQDGEPILTGNDITEAQVVDNPYGEKVIQVHMKAEAAQTWAQWTEEVVGNSIAITMDDKVYSAPVVNEPIPNGVTQISGGFSDEELTDMVIMLNCGALPAPVKVINFEDVNN